MARRVSRGAETAGGSSGKDEQRKKSWLMQSLKSAMGGKQRKPQNYEKTETHVDLQVGKTLWEDVPRDMRKELWLSILARNGRGTALGSLYMKLQTAAIPEDVDETITKDCHRSFPNHEFFQEKENQDALYRLLRAYAAYDPEVGYCQGMNFVAAVLLLHLLPRESDCFAAMVVLMQERGLRGHYTVDMRMLQIRLWQMGEVMPRQLAAHLESCGVLPALYASPWFLTIFSNEFPISFVGRVFDVLLAESDDSLLMKVAVCIMAELEEDLRGEQDLETLLYLIKNAPPNWGKNRLRKVMSSAMVHHWREKEQEKFTAEAEKTAETVKEAVERTNRIREERAASNCDLQGMAGAVPNLSEPVSEVPNGRMELAPVPRLVPPPPSSAGLSDSSRDLLSLDDVPVATAHGADDAVWSALSSAAQGHAEPVDPFAASGSADVTANDDLMSQLAGLNVLEQQPRAPQGLAGSSLTYIAPPVSATEIGIAAAIATPLAEIQRQPTGGSLASFGSFMGDTSPTVTNVMSCDSYTSFRGPDDADGAANATEEHTTIPAVDPGTPARLSRLQHALAADIRTPTVMTEGLYSSHIDPGGPCRSIGSPRATQSAMPSRSNNGVCEDGPVAYSGWLGQ